MTSLQVIGAGLGRTGTLSLRPALEELGFKPCYHMRDTHSAVNPGKDRLFKFLAEEEDNEFYIKQLFDGYKAAINYPGCLFYEKLTKGNPEAKVILTVKDSPQAWVKSTQDTIFSGNKASNWLTGKINGLRLYILPSPVYYLFKIMKKVHGVNPNDPKTDLAQMYTDWNNRVIETVPAGKLLIFNVKDGWKPLCDFLGVPVPDKPFPRANNTKEWNAEVSFVMGKVFAKMILAAGFVASGLFFLNNYLRALQF